MIEYGRRANADLEEVYAFTVLFWGADQAERYARFLLAEVEDISINLRRGKPLEDHPKIKVAFVKWSKARYGHRIVFRITSNGIFVLRILHSAMDVTEHLEEE